MDIANQILNIRKKHNLTQEEFGGLFYVTRQTVSNWENAKMVKAIDKERILGTMKRKKTIIDFFTGAGTGIVAGCLFSPDSARRTAAIFVGLVMICIGWYKKEKSDREVFRYMKEEDEYNF